MKLLSYPIVYYWTIKDVWSKLFQKRIMRTKFYIDDFITITGSIPLLVDYLSPRPVVSATSLTWFIRYIHCWKLRFRYNVIINQNYGSPLSNIGEPSWFCLSCLGPIFLLWAYLMNLISMFIFRQRGTFCFQFY